MSESSRDVLFSFLTTGPLMTLTLPSRFGSIPKLTSPLFIHGTHGARSFYFLPTWLDGGIDYPLIQTVPGLGDRTVAVYQRRDDPPQWWLRWNLASGSLYTFLEEEDTLSSASTVTESLVIIEEATDVAPFLLPEPPLARAVAARIGYGEFASFSSFDRQEGVSVRRPGFLAEGRIMANTDDAGTRFRIGAPAGCELSFFAPSESDGETMARELASSIREADAVPVS